MSTKSKSKIKVKDLKPTKDARGGFGPSRQPLGGASASGGGSAASGGGSAAAGGNSADTAASAN